MSNQEILTKAIEKAIAGGWKTPYSHSSWSVKDDTGNHYKIECLFNGQLFHDDYQRVIFNHGFARALWGDTPLQPFVRPASGRSYKLNNWQYHLQQMILADDPIKYLGEHP